MWAIIQKEFNVFFTSFIGIGLMFSFYLLIGFYTWFFQGNVLDFGFAELSVFFDLSPWFFLFFTPAICMRLFSEEFELGTFNLLQSLPISIERIIFAKILSQIFLLAIILLPTIIFIYSIGILSSPIFNIDFGIIFSAYLSLLLLIIVFVCLSALASSLSSKQALSFVLGVFLNFVFHKKYIFCRKNKMSAIYEDLIGKDGIYSTDNLLEKLKLKMQDELEDLKNDYEIIKIQFEVSFN
jgi:ABC-2 type transport system permease protein